MKGVKEIVIERVEGPTKLLKGPVTVKTWADADREIREIAETAPEEGYDKTEVMVMFDDGAVYGTRYDVQRRHGSEANVRKELLEELEFYAGQYRPPHMKQADYEAFLAQDWVIGQRERSIMFLARVEAAVEEVAA